MHGVLTEFIRWKRSFPNGSVLRRQTLNAEMLSRVEEGERGRVVKVSGIEQELRSNGGGKSKGIEWRKKNGHETGKFWSNDIKQNAFFGYA